MNNQKLKLVSCLITPLLLAACGGSGGSVATDDSCQITGSDQSITNCSSDIVGLDSNSTVQTRKVLAAGEKLTFDHGLSSAMVNAQFIYNGNSYNLEEFSNLYAAENLSSNHAFTYQSVTPLYDTNVSDNTIKTYNAGANTEYLIAFEDYDLNQTEVQIFTVDSAGVASGYTTIATIASTNGVYAQKLSDNNYLVSEALDQNTLSMQIVDNTGGIITAATSITTAGANAGNDKSRVMGDGNGDIVLCHAEVTATANPDEYTSTLNLKRFNNSLVEQSSVELTSGLVDFSDTLECHLELLPDGQIAALYEKPDGFFNNRVHFSLITDDLSPKSTVSISDTYLMQNSISQADNGDILLALELGGPDAAAYTLLNDQGEQIKTTTIITTHEPEDFATHAFADGSFALIYTEDDSLAATLKIIDQNGNMLIEESLLSPYYTIGYGKLSTLSTDNPNSFKLSYEGYEMPIAEIEVYKNRLTLEATESEVSLTNQSQHEVEVVLTVSGTQP